MNGRMKKKKRGRFPRGPLAASHYSSQCVSVLCIWRPYVVEEEDGQWGQRDGGGQRQAVPIGDHSEGSLWAGQLTHQAAHSATVAALSPDVN